MLNKVKTKALISVGAVAATSFILMMGYTAGQHSTAKQSRKEIELAAAKLVEDKQAEDKASILSSDTVLVAEIQEKIRQIASPMDAALEGRNRQNPLRSDWEEVKDEVMHQALRMKFSQNPDIAKELLATEDAASGTYLPPSSGVDLSWKQTVSLGWQKRQANLNKVKNPKVETLEDKLSKMSRAELEEEYGDVIQAYKRFTTMGQGDVVLSKWDMNDLKLLWKRYNEVKNDHLGLLPSELAKVDPKFKKRIDAMDQEALEEAYPELKTLISMAHVNPYAQLFKSETERANYDYLLDRYFLLDSQKMLSWRDPAFQTKYDYYIIEEGIDPFTGKPATQEEINRAKNIKKVRGFTDSLQLASTLYTSYVGYNQYYNKPYTTFSDVYSKVKGKIPVFNRKPVIPVFSNRYSKIDFTQTDFDVELIRGRLKTDPDTAFFWSGRTDGIGGMDVAKKIAKNKGGVTLESTIDDTNIVMPEWDFNTPSSVTAWEEASNVYAEQVSGEIRAVVGSELRPGNIWENIELPRLKANPNVTKVTTIDPKTGVEKIIFER